MPSSRRSASASSGPPTCRRSAIGFAPTPRSTSRPARRSSMSPSGRWRGRATRSADWFGILPVAPCVVVEIGEHRGEALHHRLLPRPGTRRLATRPVLHQHLRPRDAAPLRGRGARLPRGHPGPPPPARDRPGAAGPPGVPSPPRTDRLHRGLGPLHGAPVRRDGAVHRRPRSHRRALVRCLAGLSAGRRHGDARPRLDAPGGHRLHARAHGARGRTTS